MQYADDSVSNVRIPVTLVAAGERVIENAAIGC